MTRTAIVIVFASLLMPPAANAEAIPVAVRGRTLQLAHITPSASRPLSVLFLPGDGGWRGFAVTIGNRMAIAGYDVYALDTREYLEASTGDHASTVSEIADGLGLIGAAVRRRTAAPVAVVGWSEGAALAVAAASRHPDVFVGVVVFGVPAQAALGWRVRDSIASLAGREPDEPQFDVAPLLAQLRTVPLIMIQATRDPFTPVERARDLFSRASGPKRLEFIEARNHRFDGGTDRFFAALLDGLQWMRPRAGFEPRTGQAR